MALIPIRLLQISSCTGNEWWALSARSIYQNEILYCLLIYIICTSSTARGGGGSFKNRKPIGEIRCYESHIPEQNHSWIDLSN